MDYGLWLLVALLVVIALVFLLSGKKKTDAPVEPVAPVETPPAPAAVPLMAEPAAIAPAPVEPVAVEPQPEPAAPEPAATIVEPVVEPTPAPAPIAEPAPVSPAVTTPSDQGDDLLKLKGVGPKLKALLIDLGVTRFDQIAGWTDSDLAAVDAKLGNFKGRPVRDHWVDQAKYLAAGDIASFEAKYGKL